MDDNQNESKLWQGRGIVIPSAVDGRQRFGNVPDFNVSRPNENASAILNARQGLYRVHWKEEHGGGMSLAAVGQYANGRSWFAPTNWISGAVPLDEQADKIERLESLDVNDAD